MSINETICPCCRVEYTLCANRGVLAGPDTAGDKNMTGTNHNILLVESNRADALNIKRNLEAYTPYTVHHTLLLKDAEEALRSFDYDIDVILLNLELEDSAHRIQTFERLEKAKYPRDIPTLVLTNLADRRMATSIVGNGADDCLKKSQVLTQPALLRDAIDLAVCRHRCLAAKMEQKNRELRQKDQMLEWITGGYSVTK